MAALTVRLLGSDEALQNALQELSNLLDGNPLELDCDLLSPDLREFLCDGLYGAGFDGSKLVRIHSNAATGRAGDVLLSLEPSDLFLEFLSALRARN